MQPEQPKSKPKYPYRTNVWFKLRFGPQILLYTAMVMNSRYEKKCAGYVYTVVATKTFPNASFFMDGVGEDALEPFLAAYS